MNKPPSPLPSREPSAVFCLDCFLCCALGWLSLQTCLPVCHSEGWKVLQCQFESAEISAHITTRVLCSCSGRLSGIWTASTLMQQSAEKPPFTLNYHALKWFHALRSANALQSMSHLWWSQTRFVYHHHPADIYKFMRRTAVEERSCQLLEETKCTP